MDLIRLSHPRAVMIQLYNVIYISPDLVIEGAGTSNQSYGWIALCIYLYIYISIYIYIYLFIYLNRYIYIFIGSPYYTSNEYSVWMTLWGQKEGLLLGVPKGPLASSPWGSDSANVQQLGASRSLLDAVQMSLGTRGDVFWGRQGWIKLEITMVITPVSWDITPISVYI